jgi:virginiamycin B lyase
MVAKQYRAGGRNAFLLIIALMVGACGTQSQPVTSSTDPATQPVISSTTTPVRLLPTPAPSFTPRPSPTPDPQAPLEGEALVDALRQGGYVLYFNHAASDLSQTDTATGNLRNCADQQNLTDRGRAEARAIGISILALDIPIGQVLSSAYCRARDTALLAFGQAETSPDLTGFPEEESAQRIAALIRLLSTPPASGTNIVLVSHRANLANTAGISIAEGEAAVFLPVQPDGFVLIARVLPEEWQELERFALSDSEFDPLADPDLLLPDLITLPPTNLVLRVNPVNGTKLLRFTNSVQNNGPGAMEMWGHSDPLSEKTIVVQRIYKDDESFRNVVVGEFIFHPEHDHWHLGNFASYEIWSLHPDGTLDSEMASSDKVSYCLRDDARSDIPDTARFQTYLYCDQTRQGITAGWTDTYKYHLPGQYIDITDVPDGSYALRSVVDPSQQLWESDRENNAAIIYIKIEGERLGIVDLAETPDLAEALNSGFEEVAPPVSTPIALTPDSQFTIQEYDVPAGSYPHDVAPAPDGTVWYTAQAAGELGRLDPATGETHHIALGVGSSPHGVIVGPDSAPWITDSGLNAIVRVDPQTEAVRVFPLPAGNGYANLNTAVFDRDGMLWFTGQEGYYGRLDPTTGDVIVFRTERGPYGITSTPDGSVYFASLASSYVGRIDPLTGERTILEPPTPGQGARRVWSDTMGRVWVSEWHAGQVAVYDPSDDEWFEWELPGDDPQAYAVYVDEQDMVWLSDFGANALVRFDPVQEAFTVFSIPTENALVRQLLGRPGEVWGAESAADKLVVIRTGFP